jgi:DUF4097 and DUF4098 domain-containing protein YvlB
MLPIRALPPRILPLQLAARLGYLLSAIGYQPAFGRLAVFCLAVVATLGVRADEHRFSEKFDRSHPFKADGEITLSNTNGAVTIRTWDRAEIRIEGEKRAATDEELKLIAVNIDTTSDRLRLKTEFPKRRGLFGGESVRGHVTLTLTVPVTARLNEIATVNGTIALEGTRGPVRVKSVNGKLSATGLANDAAFETVNGSINATFAEVARDRKISARTVNGSATIALPKNASLTFSARSVNGSIECDFPLRLEGKTSRNRINGTIGDGAASFEANTVNGSIRVKQL